MEKEKKDTKKKRKDLEKKEKGLRKKERRLWPTSSVNLLWQATR